MKKKLHFLSILLLFFLVLFSCSKYSKIFDIESEGLSFDGKMNWGIPLINASYSIEELLSNFGEMGYIKYDSNGDYYFENTTKHEEHFLASKYLKLQYSTTVFPLTFPESEVSYKFENNLFDISTGEMKFINAILKSGELKFNIYDLSVQGIDFEVVIESKSIFDKAHKPLVVNLSKKEPAKNIPAAELIMETEDGKLNFDITITTIGTQSLGTIIFRPQIALSEITLKQAEVELLKELTHANVTASSFSVFPDNTSLNAIVHHPKLTFDITNTFGSIATINISEAYLKGNTTEQSILIENDTKFNVSENFSGTLEVPNTRLEIPVTSDFDSLVFKYTVNIPKGRIKIFDYSTVESTIIFNVFFDITVNVATFTDTIPFGLAGLNALSFLDTIRMRTAFESSMPLDMYFQILFYDSKTDIATDSLLSQPLTIKGSYDGTVVPSKVQFINITNDRIKKLQQADQMIISISLNTEGKHKPFNKKNMLQTKLGVQIITVPKF